MSMTDGEASPPRTPPPRRRAERLACGLPAYINTQKGGITQSEEALHIPEITASFRPRPGAPGTAGRRPYAAPGAFLLPPEVMTYPTSAELVVAVAQDGLNRWLNNISTQVSHEGREHQMGWPQHIPGDLPSLRNFRPSWSDLAGERETRGERETKHRELPMISEETSGILRGGAEMSGKENVNLNLPEISKM
ncbi:Golt1a [Symbiodinium sp. CCMP2592]|nr:Golt1a [Symbiodinium sp. CCMP2592]